MNILITGASGFTGQHFENFATKAGHSIIALKADLSDKNAVKEEVEKTRPEAVVHLAAISFVAHEDASAFYAVNVVGTLHLLEALCALEERPKKVLLAGSAHVYGNSEISPIPETQCPAPGSHYATSKLAMEYMSRTYMDRLPIIITRPFNYTGPGQAPYFVIPKLVNHFAEKADSIQLGNIKVEREFNDVRMVCEAYLKLLELGIAGETYNICSEQPRALDEVIEILKRISGHRIEVQHNPAFFRNNEIDRLCGSVRKLKSVIGELTHYTLEDTLSWMLESTLQRPRQ